MQRVLEIALVAGLLASWSRAQCDDWLEGFKASVATGVEDSTVWSSGGVDRLVLIYAFAEAGNTVGRAVVAWDGANWDNLNGGLVGGGFGSAACVATFDEGAGSRLFVGGSIGGTVNGAVTLRNIARWDGSNWSDVGGGLTGPTPFVNAMTEFDDGSGPALYVAGSFAAAGGVPAANVARWSGSSWSSVGNGLGSGVLALAAFDDGSGAKLYASRQFGGGATLHVWDGVNWSSVPGAPNFAVHTLATLDLGAGTQLFLGGDFTTAGGASAARVASWNGSIWTAYGAGLPARVSALATYDTGAGARLLAGGQFSLGGQHAIAEWNGSSWSALAGGIPVPSSITSPASVWTLREFTIGLQRVLVAGGSYGLRYLHEGVWRSVASVSTHIPHVLVDYDDGTGVAPFSISRPATATFPTLGAPVVWKHEQMQWSPVPGSPCGVARALVAFDDGNGERLFVGGTLDTPTGAAASDIQVYDGSSWSPLGVTPNFEVYDLEWFDAGNGPELYAAGEPKFGGPNATLLGHVIRWDGVSWSAIGGPRAWCVALETYDDGAGPKLYVGGYFPNMFSSSNFTRGLAVWDGSTWSDVGAGLSGASFAWVRALVRWNDGTGEKLYIGGHFASAGGVPDTVHIASWDGANFAPLGIGWTEDVHTLAVDTGATPSTLVVGGAYTTLPGNYGARERGGLMRWNGVSWSQYAGGLEQSSFSQVGARVSSVVVANVGDGVDLLVSGTFRQLGDTFSPYFGVWNRCTPPGEPYCSGAGGGPVCTCLNASPVEAQGGCVNSSGRAAVLRGDGSASVAQNDLTLRTHGLPPTTSCILFVGSLAPSGGAGEVFADGLRCAGGATRRLGLRTSDSQGFATWGPGLNAQAGWLAGQTRYLQTWCRDPSGPCGRGSNTSNGYRIVFGP